MTTIDFFMPQIPKDKRPPPICPSCERPTTWRISKEHPESCYECTSCGECYIRQRDAVLVPIGMTQETAKALFGESPFRGFLQKTEEAVEKPNCPICGAIDCIHLVNNKKFECRSPSCGNLHDDVDDILCRECRPVDQTSEAGIQFIEVDNHDEACLEVQLDYKKGHIFLSKDFWDCIREQAWPQLVSDLPRNEQLELELVQKIAEVEKTRPSDVVLSSRVTTLEGELFDLHVQIRILKTEKESYYERIKTAEAELDDANKGLKQVLAQSNQAMVYLWDFIDSISMRPRHGNIFERAKECLPVARQWAEWLLLMENGQPDENTSADKVRKLMRNYAEYRHDISVLTERVEKAKDNAKLDALDILDKVGQKVGGLNQEDLYWVNAKLKDMANGKGRGGIQS